MALYNFDKKEVGPGVGDEVGPRGLVYSKMHVDDLDIEEVDHPISPETFREGIDDNAETPVTDTNKLLTRTDLGVFGSGFSDVSGLQTGTHATGSIVVVGGIQGGTFIYDSTQSGINDKGDVINGWVRQREGLRNPKHYGIYRGASNVETKLRDMLELGGDFDFSELDIDMSTAITINTPVKIRIFGNGGKITCTGDNIYNLLQFNNTSLYIDTLEIDGDFQTQRCIWSTIPTTIYNCYFHGVYSGEVSASAMCVGWESTIKSDLTVINCKLVDGEGTVTGGTGTAPGTTRGVYVRMLPGSSGSTIRIVNNVMGYFYGREGDTVQISQEIVDLETDETTFLIQGNTFYESTRRCIKGFGARISVIDNEFHSLKSGDPKEQIAGGMVSIAPQAVTVSDTYYNKVSGNKFYNYGGTNSSLLIADGTSCSVTNNDMFHIGTHSFGIGGFSNMNKFTFSGNRVDTPSSMKLDGVMEDVTISDNDFHVVSNCRSILEETVDTYTNVAIDYNRVHFSSSAKTANLFLGLLFQKNVNNYISLSVSGNTLDAYTGSSARANAVYFSQDATGLVVMNNRKGEVGTLITKSAGKSIYENIITGNKDIAGVSQNYKATLTSNLMPVNSFNQGVTGFTLTGGASYVASEDSVQLLGTSDIKNDNIAGLITLDSVYKLEIELSNTVYNNWRIYAGGTQILGGKSSTSSDEGKNTFFFKSPVNADYIKINNGHGSTDMQIKSITLREVTL